MDSNSIIDDYRREKKRTPEKPLYNDTHKMWFHKGMFQQKKFYEIMSHPSLTLYCLFRAYIIRGSGRSSLYKRIKSEYYDNGDLACALSYKEMREKTGWYNSKIQRYVNYLKDVRVIRVSEIDVGKRFKQQVYILGRVSEIGDERYFIDEIINEP